MWNVLRREPFHGFHFRRQVQLGRYYADFASHTAKLVIEIDGSAHFNDDAADYDANRGAFLHSQGYTVLRFTTSDVLNSLDAVAAALTARLPAAVETRKNS
jgi:very-short-patch-repair endonuclease